MSKKGQEQLEDINIKERLSAAWGQADMASFCELVEELCRVIGSKYSRDYPMITFEEFQDCYYEVIYKILEDFQALGARVKDPWLYIWSAVLNAIFDLFKERNIDVAGFKERAKDLETEAERHEDVEWSDRYSDSNGSEKTSNQGNDISTTLSRDDGKTLNIHPEHAIYLLEGLLEEYDFSAQVAKQVVEIALSHFPRTQRTIIEIILERGPDYNSRDAEKEYNIRHYNYRKNKERAYEKLKTLVPEILSQNSIEVRIREVEEVFIEAPSEFPSREEN